MQSLHEKGVEAVPDLLTLKIDGELYLFHPVTFKIYRIDSETDDIIHGRKPGFDGLADLRQLLSENKSEQVQIKKNYISEIPIIRCLNIDLTDSCNLRCRYCYSPEAGCRDESVSKSIGFPIVRKAIDQYFKQIEDEKGNFAIDFFGGEPLLHYRLIEKVVNYVNNHESCRDKTITYNITTNGTLMTEEKILFFKRNNFRIIISLDGDRQIHDRNRLTREGTGTYDRVYETIELFKKISPDNYQVRATITPSCVDLTRITGHFDEMGVDLYGFELMYSNSNKTAEAWDLPSVKEYDFQYGLYADSVLKRILSEGFRSRNLLSLLNRLRQIKRGSKKYFPCQMAREAVVLSTDGNYYPCHWLAGNADYAIGDVNDGINQEKRLSSYPVLAFENGKCSRCWCRYLCAGGCPSVSILNNGTISEPDKWVCNDRRIMWKWMVWLYIQLLNRKPSLLSLL